MTVKEKISSAIAQYTAEHGKSEPMSKAEIYKIINSKYPLNESSFLPYDYCYNRTNDGIDFESHIHLFEYVDAGTYRILGENFPYTGKVYCENSGIKGVWENGIYTPEEK